METKLTYYVAGKDDRWHIILHPKGNAPMIYATYNSCKNATREFFRLQWIDKEWISK